MPGETPTAADEPAVEFTDTGVSTGIEAEDIGEAGRMPFDPELIDVAPRNPTIDLVLQRLKRGLIDLQPDFQRRSGIWNDTAQSRLIESLLLRMPGLLLSRVADFQNIALKPCYSPPKGSLRNAAPPESRRLSSAMLAI